MLKQNVNVKDQFGINHAIQATVDNRFSHTQCSSDVKYITVDGEDIRPGFEMFFQSIQSGKIFQIVSVN